MADLPKSTTLKDQLAFTCSYEKDRLPPLDPEQDLLHKRAVWIYKKNLLKNDPVEYAKAERLYRIAAAHGHYKAAHNLLMMILRGESNAPGNIGLAVDLAEGLIKQGIPQGYFDMGVLLNKGYGVKPDEGAALQYFRKAADLGNAEAQYYIGNKLTELTRANPIPYEIGYEMIRCAGEQNHAKAASVTGTHIKHDVLYDQKGSFSDALKYYHLSVKAGSSQAANTLRKQFLAEPPSNELGLARDEERSRRYDALQDILSGYDYLNATVDEIDEIVPLPPAKLPPWDGQIKWVKEWEKNEPPPLPSEERIAELALEKSLNPETGWLVKINYPSAQLLDPESGEPLKIKNETILLLRKMRSK